MSQQHTTTIIGQQIASVEFVQDDARWHRVLNVLWDEGVMASLSDRGFRVLGAFLRLRQHDGTAFAPTSDLARLTTYADRTIRSARAELLGHPRRLLAALGSDRFSVLPGWSFAGRSVPPPGTVVPQIGTTVPPTCVPSRETRARQTNQPKTGQIDQNQSGENQGGERCAEPVVGWPISNRGIAAMTDGDVYGLLMALGVWDYMARPISECLHVTVERVLAMAGEVARDPRAGNRGYCLGYRLAEAFGIKLPQSPARGRITAQGVASGLEGVARLRIERMRQQSVQVQYEEADS